MADNLKLIRLVLFPFLIFTFVIYACLYLITPIRLAYEISMLLGLFSTSIVIYCERLSYKKIFAILFDWKSICLVVPAIFIIFVFGFVLSPLIKQVAVDGHTVFGLTALGDYYKHLYVLSAIKTGGLPAHHPFFPSANLSYYYGYYLIPAAISNAFNLNLARVFFFYILTTTFIVLYVVIQIAMGLFTTWYQRLLSFVLFVFGTGLDIVPTLIQAKTGALTANHIEFWSQVLNLSNFLVNNLYTALLWVPQHTLPGIVALVTGLIIIKDKKVSFFWLTFAVWFCFISSTFVSIALVIWLGLAFIFFKKNRLSLLISGIFVVCLLYPYLIELSGRGSLLSFGFYMTPFLYLPFAPKWINICLTFFTEYGLIIAAIPIFIAVQPKSNHKKAIYIALAILLPIIIGLFVKSAGFNDYSMRSILPSQMALPFLMAYSLSNFTVSIWKRSVFVLLLLSLIPSMAGFFYEVHFRLIDRGVIDWQSSEMLTNLRRKPVTNLAAISNEDWVFLIPSYGFQPLFSPRLFDSSGYISGMGLVEQELYAKSVNNLFIYQKYGTSPTEIFHLQQEKLQKIDEFFASHQQLNFIVSKGHGTKNGFDVWYKIFEQSNTKGEHITSRYTIYKGKNLYDALKLKNISASINFKKIFLDRNNQLSLNQGVWLIIGCNYDQKKPLRLEFEDEYLLFSVDPGVNSSRCAGDLYYQPKNSTLNISNTSKFDTLYVSPVTISDVSSLN